MFLSWAGELWLGPPGDTWPYLGTFLAVTARRVVLTGVSWVQARGAAPHPMVPRTAPHIKERSAQDIIGADVGKPRLKVFKVSTSVLSLSLSRLVTFLDPGPQTEKTALTYLLTLNSDPVRLPNKSQPELSNPWNLGGFRVNGMQEAAQGNGTKRWNQMMWEIILCRRWDRVLKLTLSRPTCVSLGKWVDISGSPSSRLWNGKVALPTGYYGDPNNTTPVG